MNLKTKHPFEISNTLANILLAILLGIFFLFFLRQIVFVNADLGRHLKNGELFLSEFQLFKTNFYSYTEPDFPTITHHWGAGVIFYLLFKVFGFKGLTVFYGLIHALALFLIYKASSSHSKKEFVLVSIAIMIPLLAYRFEVRPEGFSYLFVSIFYYLLSDFRANNNPKKLYILPILMLFWVNLHLFFIFGLFVLLLFTLESYILKNTNFKTLFQVSIASLLAAFLNPNFLNGFLEPFLILKEYGYMVAENQSIMFMYDRFESGVYLHALVGIVACTIASLIFVFQNKFNFLPEVLLGLLFCAIAFFAIRGISFFAIFFIPIFSLTLTSIVKDELINKLSLGITTLAILVFISSKTNYMAAKTKDNFGIGMIKNIDKSAKFFKETGLKGPIFNNYDLGGFLIYSLYPQEKVFVDNRPEAYSVKFFKEIYELMQEKEEIWKQIEEKYKFNCIYFFRHDQTPHAQPFLIRRIEDPSWIPVFVDDVAIILLKDLPQNQTIIKQYGLPKSMFSSKPTR